MFYDGIQPQKYTKQNSSNKYEKPIANTNIIEMKLFRRT